MKDRIVLESGLVSVCHPPALMGPVSGSTTPFATRGLPLFDLFSFIYVYQLVCVVYVSVL